MEFEIQENIETENVILSSDKEKERSFVWMLNKGRVSGGVCVCDGGVCPVGACIILYCSKFGFSGFLTSTNKMTGFT